MKIRLRHIVLIGLAYACATVSASDFIPTGMSQYDRVGFSLLGGYATHMQTATPTLGGEVLLGVQYAHYWRHDSWPLQLGLSTGARFGYSQSSFSDQAQLSRTFTITEDILTYPIDYDVDVMAHETNRQGQLRVPLLLSMASAVGVYAHVGPELMVPFASRYTNTITQSTIAATYSMWSNEPLINQPLTGTLPVGTATKGKWDVRPVQLLLDAEVGYEYEFRDKNRLAVGLYATYALPIYGSPSAANGAKFDFVTIVPPSPTQPAIVTSSSLVHSLGTECAYLSVGVTVSYYIVW